MKCSVPAFIQMPLQEYLRLNPGMASFFPADVFPPSDPYVIRLCMTAFGGYNLEVGFFDDAWVIGV